MTLATDSLEVDRRQYVHSYYSSRLLLSVLPHSMVRIISVWEDWEQATDL
jgi:hypothetical protein